MLRCTKKLLAILGASSVSEPGPAPDDDDWYANLVWLDGRKCLLLAHVATLFTIFEPDVRAVDVQSMKSFVSSLIGRELHREGLPRDTFATSDDLVITRTADRRVLGCMNDMSYLCEAAVQHTGSLEKTNIAALNHSLRRNMNSSRNYERPIDLTIARVECG